MGRGRAQWHNQRAGLEDQAERYLVAIDDKLIPPPAQHFMAERADATVVEVGGRHAIYVSQTSAVAAIIEKAA